MDKILKYDFAKEFTDTPGPRYKTLGSFSGEEFREVLTHLLKQYEKIEIDGSGIKSSFSPLFFFFLFLYCVGKWEKKFFSTRSRSLAQKIQSSKKNLSFIPKI